MAEGKLKTVPLEDSVRALIFKNRNLLGLSGEQLGYLTGDDQSSIRKIENGERSPSLMATFNLLLLTSLLGSDSARRHEGSGSIRRSVLRFCLKPGFKKPGFKRSLMQKGSVGAPKNTATVRLPVSWDNCPTLQSRRGDGCSYQDLVYGSRVRA